MFAADSMANLRSRRRPLLGGGSRAGSGSEAPKMYDPRAPQQLVSSEVEESSSSSISSTFSAQVGSKKRPFVLPIEDLRAQVAAAASKRRRKHRSGSGAMVPVAPPSNLKPPPLFVPGTTAEGGKVPCHRLETPWQGSGIVTTTFPEAVRRRRMEETTQYWPSLEGAPVEGAATAAAVGAGAKEKNSKGRVRAVRFELDRNVVYELDWTPEDLTGAWMSRHESDLVRQRNIESIAAYRAGAVDYDHESLRGLEVHLDPELVRKKVKNCRNYASLILDQQRFLRSVMGYCNESILSRMSSLLTHEDRLVAFQAAQSDAREALRIHELAATPELPIA